jgi:hypothetical protein
MDLQDQVQHAAAQWPQVLHDRHMPFRLREGNGLACRRDDQIALRPGLAGQRVSFAFFFRRNSERIVFIRNRSFQQPDTACTAPAQAAIMRQAHIGAQCGIEHSLIGLHLEGLLCLEQIYLISHEFLSKWSGLVGCRTEPSLFDIGLDQDFEPFVCQGRLQGFKGRQTALGILFAITAA